MWKARQKCNFRNTTAVIKEILRKSLKILQRVLGHRQSNSSVHSQNSSVSRKNSHSFERDVTLLPSEEQLVILMFAFTFEEARKRLSYTCTLVKACN